MRHLVLEWGTWYWNGLGTWRGVANVLEVLALHLLLHREVERSQPLATVCSLHLDTNVSVSTGPHPIQDGAEESISVREGRGGEEEG